MNREIEFRGKYDETGEWEYGNLCQYDDGSCWIRNKNYYDKLGYLTRSVIPETVGQYTGLKAKDGIKIFEYDYVDYVKADGKTYQGYIKYYKDGFDIFRDGISDCSIRGVIEIAVTGNMHDKELGNE